MNRHAGRSMMPASALLLALLSPLGTELHAVQAEDDLHIELEEDLVIGEDSGVSFGGGLRVAVDSRGRIYVGDWMNRTIQVFGSDGEPRSTVGRSGRGPGEFTGVHQIVAGRGDSLYVFDANQLRLSVYAPGETPELSYTVRLATAPELGRPYGFFVPRQAADDFLFAYRHVASGTVRMHRVNAAGEVAEEPILVGEAHSSVQRVGKAGGGVRVTKTSPLFGREPLLGLTPDDRLYYGWSERVDFNFYDLSGRWIRMFKSSAPNLPVTDEDVEYELRGASETRRNALRGQEHADTKPAIDAILVDDELRIWTRRFTSDPGIRRWWVTPHGVTGKSAIFELPEHVDIQVVRDGYAYAASEDAVGFPIVVRYRIETEG